MALLQAGEMAPTFKGLNLTGPEFQFDNVKGQKPVIVIFGPDQVNPVQTKSTAAVYKKLGGEVEMVILSRKLPSVAMAKAFLAQYGLKAPTVYDPKQEVYKLYGVEKPVVIFSVDKEGKIVNVAEYDPRGMTPTNLEEAAAKARGENQSAAAA